MLEQGDCALTETAKRRKTLEIVRREVADVARLRLADRDASGRQLKRSLFELVVHDDAFHERGLAWLEFIYSRPVGIDYGVQN